MTPHPTDGRAARATAASFGREDSPRRAWPTRCCCAKIATSVKLLNAQPIRRQRVAVTCLMTLPLMAAIGWDASRTRLERAAEVRDQAAAVATAAAAAVDQYFASLDAMASVLVRHPAIRALDGDEFNLLLAALLVDQPLVANVSLRDRNGVVRAAGAGLVDGRPQQVPAPPHVLEVLATGRPTVTDFAVGQVSGRPTVFQAYPVRGADDSVIGVINFAVNVSRLQQVF